VFSSVYDEGARMTSGIRQRIVTGIIRDQTEQKQDIGMYVIDKDIN
jgi:hypothetical protein